MKESFRQLATRIPEIITGWANYVKPTPQIEEMGLTRLEVCIDCEQNSTPATVVLKSRCKACGCFIQAKSRNPESKCPKDKWPV